MLIALLTDNQQSVVARDAVRGEGFICPSCRNEVLLKRGRVRIPHFAHRATQVCPDSAGETERHRECKQAIYDALRSLPTASQVELEKRFPSHGVRADVFANIRGVPVAIELQRSNLSIADLERRTTAYMALGAAVLWVVAHLRAPAAGADRYAPRDWERWLNEMYWGRVYYWLEGSLVMPVAFTPYAIYVEERTWYSAGGYEEYGGGYSYTSRRFVTPHNGTPIDVATGFTKAARKTHQWGGVVYPQASLYVGTDNTFGAVKFS